MNYFLFNVFRNKEGNNRPSSDNLNSLAHSTCHKSWNKCYIQDNTNTRKYPSVRICVSGEKTSPNLTTLWKNHSSTHYMRITYTHSNHRRLWWSIHIYVCHHLCITTQGHWYYNRFCTCTNFPCNGLLKILSWLCVQYKLEIKLTIRWRKKNQSCINCFRFAYIISRTFYNLKIKLKVSTNMLFFYIYVNRRGSKGMGTSSLLYGIYFPALLIHFIKVCAYCRASRGACRQHHITYRTLHSGQRYTQREAGVPCLRTNTC